MKNPSSLTSGDIGDIFVHECNEITLSKCKAVHYLQ